MMLKYVLKMTEERKADLSAELLRGVLVLSFRYNNGKYHCGGGEVLLILARHVSEEGFKLEHVQEMLLKLFGKEKYHYMRED